MSAPFRDDIKRIWQSSNHPFEDLWDWAKKPRTEEARRRRWNALAKWAGSHKRHEDHDSEDWKDWKRRQRIYKKKVDANTSPDVPGIEDGGWHPEARRAGVVNGIGALEGTPKLVWHTTQGFGLPSYSGSNPHFTLDVAHNVLYQHQDVRLGARALEAEGTGNEKSIQVELIGYAEQSQNWTDQSYENIADLARWIEKHCNIKRECTVKFVGNEETNHMTLSKWEAYNGHCGHQHVPYNAHWDPGALKIDKVLDK